MRPRPIPAPIVFSALLLVVPSPHAAAMAGTLALPLTSRQAPSLPRLDAPAAVRPLDPLPEGRWRNYGLLQNDNHAAFYDPAQDRLICIGGGRDGSWELPLTGTMTWRELVNIPYQPWPVGWWATEYDASTGDIYFEAIGPNNTLVMCRMDPTTGSFEPLWADDPPTAITFMSMVFDRAHQRFFVFGGQNLENFELPDDVWVLDLLPTRRWSHWTPAGESPKGRIGGALVLDAARNRMLLLGGLALVNPGVWALSLDEVPTWTRLSETALPGDANPNGMVLDPAGDRVLALHSSGDLWTFSLRTNEWSVPDVSGPHPRGRLLVPLVLDTARHRLLITGGLSSDESDRPNDAWALSLDGTPRWTPLVSDVARPPIRTAASGAVDAARNRLVVFGGANTDGRLLDDTWQLDLNATRWSRVEAQGPGPLGRYWHASAYDPMRDQLVVFSGYGSPDTSQFFSDLWTLSFAGGVPTWQVHAPPGPKPAARVLANLVYDPPHDRFILMFGSTRTSTFTDVWELRFTPEATWRKMTPVGPVPFRAAAMAVFDPARDRILLFGGGNSNGTLDDTWELRLTTVDGAWNPIGGGPRPLPRALGLLEMDVAHDRVLLFGGEDELSFLDDVWELPLGGIVAWRQLSPAGAMPAARSRMVGAYDPVHERLILSSGGFNRPTNDTWGLEFQTGAAPLQLEVAEVDATPDRVRVTWTTSVPALGVHLDRAVDDGPWRTLAALRADALGRIEYEDRDVSAGALLRYRLAVVWDSEELLLGLASVTVPTRSMALSVANPTTDMRFRLELPSGAPATLTIYDVAGRRVWSREVGGLGPGKHDVTTTDATWRSGVYFARLTQAGQMRAVRFAALR